MLANPDIGVTQITHRLGVSPAALYRHIPPEARTANTPSVWEERSIRIVRPSDFSEWLKSVESRCGAVAVG